MDMMSYLMGKNSGGGGKGAKIEVVTELPETGEANVIYLVPKETEDENNVFDEYLYINNEWELIGSTAIDISGKQDTMQFSTMPTPSIDYLGKIVQYIGTTNANYTNGYFYVCIGTTENDVITYSWSNLNVQDGGETIVLVDNGNQYSTASSLNTEANIAQIKKLCELYSIGKRPTVCYIGAVRGGGSQSGGTASYMYYAKYNIYYNDSRQEYTINFETVPAPYYSGSKNINGVGFRVIDQWVFNATYRVSIDSVTFANKSMVPCLGVDNYNNNPYAYPFSLENFCTKLGLEIYSTSKTYQIGDYIYARDMNLYGPGVILYKCNTADTTGTWDSSKWTQATFMEYLSDTLVGGALNGSY